MHLADPTRTGPSRSRNFSKADGLAIEVPTFDDRLSVADSAPAKVRKCVQRLRISLDLLAQSRDLRLAQVR